MQLECFVDGDGLNSGVFFRSILGDYANGYESQIQNAVKDGDPTKPVDAGTSNEMKPRPEDCQLPNSVGSFA